MRIILREDVPNLGEAGDVVEVKDGFARNYLLPRRLAIRATATTEKALAHERKLREDRLRKLRKGADSQAEQLGRAECVIPVKVGEGDRLYGSVTRLDIQEALAAGGIVLDRRRILLEEPIKHLGDYAVRVRLHPEVTAEVPVRVVRAEEGGTTPAAPEPAAKKVAEPEAAPQGE